MNVGGFFFFFLMDPAKGLEASGEKTLQAEVKAFFDSAPPLQKSDEITQKLNQFIQRISSPSGKFPPAAFNFAFHFLYGSYK